MFCSVEFNTILEIIDRSKREAFANQLIKAIEHRVPGGDMQNLLKNIGLEQMISKWGYSHKKISKMLATNYAEQLSWQTVKTINNLSGNQIRIKQHQ